MLVWGFSSKSYIETIFSKQKKGLRAVIPGFINYKYRDGNIPGHTKTFFTEYNYRSLLPLSILNTIPENSPNSEDTHESCENWLSTYNNNHYRKSVFYKGPLLSTGSDINKNLSPASFANLASYKNNLKQSLLSIQNSGISCEWKNDNFLLYNIPGLRKSQAQYRNVIDYFDN